MPYRAETGSNADAPLGRWIAAIGVGVERQILWPANNADVMKWRGWEGRRVSLLRVGDWRILYRLYHLEKIVRIQRIQHRS